MSDIFGRTDQVFGGGLSADSLFLIFPGLTNEPGSTNDGLGLLIQNIGLQYTQPVRRIYELGPGVSIPGGGHSQVTYYVVGRPEGNFNFGRIVGFTALSVSFYSTYGDPCNPDPSLQLTGGGACLPGSLAAEAGFGVDVTSANLTTSSVTWDMDGVLLTQIGMAATAQEMLIQEQVGGMMIGLKISVSPSNPT